MIAKSLERIEAEGPELERARLEREQQAAYQREQAQRQGMLAQLVAAAGERYRECRLKSFQVTNQRQKAVTSAIAEYADDLVARMVEAANLVLYGPCGTGKDHLAYHVAGRAIVVFGKSVEWVNGQDWFGDLRDGMDRGSSERDVIRRYTAPDYLVLSDPLPPFGALTQFQSTMLYRLVDERYARAKPTICTVNVSSDQEADERLGVATWDRLCHGAWKLFCNWPSYRKPARIVNA